MAAVSVVRSVSAFQAARERVERDIRDITQCLSGKRAELLAEIDRLEREFENTQQQQQCTNTTPGYGNEISVIWRFSKDALIRDINASALDTTDLLACHSGFRDTRDTRTAPADSSEIAEIEDTLLCERRSSELRRYAPTVRGGRGRDSQTQHGHSSDIRRQREYVSRSNDMPRESPHRGIRSGNRNRGHYANESLVNFPRRDTELHTTGPQRARQQRRGNTHATGFVSQNPHSPSHTPTQRERPREDNRRNRTSAAIPAVSSVPSFEVHSYPNVSAPAVPGQSHATGLVSQNPHSPSHTPTQRERPREDNRRSRTSAAIPDVSSVPSFGVHSYPNVSAPAVPGPTPARDTGASWYDWMSNLFP